MPFVQFILDSPRWRDCCAADAYAIVQVVFKRLITDVIMPMQHESVAVQAQHHHCDVVLHQTVQRSLRARARCASAWAA